MQMEEHELNDGFEWCEREGPFRLISEEQAVAYNRDGYFVMEDVFDDETVNGLLTELDPLEDEGAEFLREHLGGKAFIARADEKPTARQGIDTCPVGATCTCHRIANDHGHFQVFLASLASLRKYPILYIATEPC